MDGSALQIPIYFRVEGLHTFHLVVVVSSYRSAGAASNVGEFFFWVHQESFLVCYHDTQNYTLSSRCGYSSGTSVSCNRMQPLLLGNERSCSIPAAHVQASVALGRHMYRVCIVPLSELHNPGVSVRLPNKLWQPQSPGVLL